jgi:hypothetical protein
MLSSLDISFDQFVAKNIPDVNLAAALECSSTVTARLHEITGRHAKFAPSNGASACGASSTKIRVAARNASQAVLLADARSLEPLGPAPDFMDTQDWFNTGTDGHSNKPLTLASLRGGVVLVDFWTYTPSSTKPATCATRSNSSACATRSCRTTTWARGTRTATSTGPRTT